MNKRLLVTFWLALGIVFWPNFVLPSQASQINAITELPLLELSLPFNTASRWSSVDDQTPGIVWTAGISEIKFGIQNSQFVAGNPETDTWFVYGWFGALEAIKQPYNVKYPEWGDRHNGIDFAGREGIEVVSASTGKVIFAGKKIGNTVIIDSGDGYQITYGHLQNISVKKNQQVKVGDLLGHLGKTGTVNPHLHFQVDLIKKARLASESKQDSRTAINPVPLFDTEWGNVIIPAAPANQFYTDNQNPLEQPDFNW
ncbi:MAG: M23 family metallopeptidase [Patescibacteria group bacterium]|jgi:murein DD-endopeptidase MepM/ murein hydrolase activator NlpD